MIDIENEVITLIHDGLYAKNITASIESVLNLNPSEFPTVCVEEIENSSLDLSADSSSNENHVSVGYEINVFTNDVTGKKNGAKDIHAAVDEIMLKAGFTRISKNQFALDNGTKFRLVARYRAYVSKQNIIYRR